MDRRRKQTQNRVSAAMRLRGKAEREGGEKRAREVTAEVWWSEPISEEEKRS